MSLSYENDIAEDDSYESNDEESFEETDCELLDFCKETVERLRIYCWSKGYHFLNSNACVEDMYDMLTFNV